MIDYTHALWLTHKDSVVKYAIGSSRKQLESLVPKITVEFDSWSVKPNLDYVCKEESRLYDIYIDNQHYYTEKSLDKVVKLFRNWSEEDLKRAYIKEIITKRVELIR